MINRRGFLALLGSAIAAVKWPWRRVSAPMVIGVDLATGPDRGIYYYRYIYVMADGTEIEAPMLDSHVTTMIAQWRGEAELRFNATPIVQE